MIIPNIPGPRASDSLSIAEVEEILLKEGNDLRGIINGEVGMLRGEIAEAIDTASQRLLAEVDARIEAAFARAKVEYRETSVHPPLWLPHTGCRIRLEGK